MSPYNFFREYLIFIICVKVLGRQVIRYHVKVTRKEKAYYLTDKDHLKMANEDFKTLLSYFWVTSYLINNVIVRNT